MRVLNILSGPGAGKSTLAAGLYYTAKCKGLHVELVTEVAKDLAWEGREKALRNQAYVFGRQVQRVDRVSHNDLVITDSPFLLSAIYAPKDYPKSWEDVVVQIWKRYNNHVLLLKRGHNFEDEGRLHNFQESLEIDKMIDELLAKHDIQFTNVNHDYSNLDELLETVLEKRA